MGAGAAGFGAFLTSLGKGTQDFAGELDRYQDKKRLQDKEDEREKHDKDVITRATKAIEKGRISAASKFLDKLSPDGQAKLAQEHGFKPGSPAVISKDSVSGIDQGTGGTSFQAPVNAVKAGLPGVGNVVPKGKSAVASLKEKAAPPTPTKPSDNYSNSVLARLAGEPAPVQAPDEPTTYGDRYKETLDAAEGDPEVLAKMSPYLQSIGALAEDERKGNRQKREDFVADRTNYANIAERDASARLGYDELGVKKGDLALRRAERNDRLKDKKDATDLRDKTNRIRYALKSTEDQISSLGNLTDLVSKADADGNIKTGAKGKESMHISELSAKYPDLFTITRSGRNKESVHFNVAKAGQLMQALHKQRKDYTDSLYTNGQFGFEDNSGGGGAGGSPLDFPAR